jgi:hypothetical protein
MTERRILIVNEQHFVIDAPNIQFASGQLRSGYRLGVIDLGNHVVMLLVSAFRIELKDVSDVC